MLSKISYAQIIFVAAILTLTYFIYTRILKPYRQYCIYKSLISANFKAYIHPFSLTPIEMFKQQNQDLKKHGDSQYTIKYVFREYQIIMRMFQDSVFLELVDPKLIRQFYQKTAEWCYVKTDKGFFVIPFGLVLGTGLVLSQQHKWKSKRKIMSNVFNYDFLKSKINTISNIVKSELNKIQQNQKTIQSENPKYVKFNVNSALQQIFGEVVIKCFFGDINLHKIKGQPIFRFFNRLMQLTVIRSRTVFALIFGPKFFKYNLRPIDRKVNKMNQQFNEYARNIINDQIQGLQKSLKNVSSSNQQNQIKKSSGVIQLLVKSKKIRKQQSNSDNQIKSDQFCYSVGDLIDQFKTFFFAGTDTTSNNTTVLIYTLAKRKDILQKIRQQINEVIGDNTDNITYQKLKELKYLQKVQKQALRMFSPTTGLFKRVAVKDHYIGSIPIKKGMIVTPNIDSNHFKQEFYKDPQVFDPDRWTNIDSSKSDPYSFYPFSSGQRNCIGQHLAIIQSKIALIHLLTRYKQIKLQKAEFQLYFRTIYGAESMTTTFSK